MSKKYNRWLGDDGYDARLVKPPPADYVYPRQPQESALEDIPAMMCLTIRGSPGFFLGLPGEPGGDDYIGIPQSTEGNIVVVAGNGSGKSAGISKPTLRTWRGRFVPLISKVSYPNFMWICIIVALLHGHMSFSIPCK